MFAKERQELIVQTVNAEGRATVTDLARRFDVTEDSIRKDLKHLSGEGLLQRVYGGAISVASHPERDISERVGTKVEQKRAIAQKAFALLEPGETVFLDVSTTNLALAEKIAASATAGTNLTVVTNMVDIIQKLAGCQGVRVVCAGGLLNTDLDAFLGALTLQVLAAFRFDKAFMGALGVNPDSGEVLTYDFEDGAVKRQVIRTASRSILMVDDQKFGASGSYCFANLEDLDAVVCNAPTEALRQELAQFDCTLI